MELIKIGKIVNTHGIKGEVRILSKFPYKDKVFIKGMPIYISKENREIISSYRRHKNFDMITLEGYTNINEVLKYKGKYVYINREDILLDNDNYLDEDIIGLSVYVNDSYKGMVNNIERYDNTVLLSIINDKEFLVPYELIDKIDINNEKLYIFDRKTTFRYNICNR